MKNITPIRHGEVILKHAELPEGAELVTETKRYIVAHSESGHNHVLELDTSKMKVYSWNGSTYIELPEYGKLLHEKTGEHAHKTHVIEPAVYKVNIKKQYNYFTKMIEKVRD